MVEIHMIEFADNMPEMVNISMPVEVLAHLVKHVGGLPGNEHPHPGYHELYDVAVSTVFNTFWEDGVDGCIEGSA